MSQDEKIKSKILDVVFFSGSINLTELKESGWNINLWNWMYSVGLRYDGSGSFFVPNFTKF